jgi:hypothetical protein
VDVEVVAGVGKVLVGHIVNSFCGMVQMRDCRLYSNLHPQRPTRYLQPMQNRPRRPG